MSTDQSIRSDSFRERTVEGYTNDRLQNYPGDVAWLNGHELVAIDEWLPGIEPSPYEVNLIDSYEHRTRYWRCRNCVQERNRRDDFVKPCEDSQLSTPLETGGYSIDEPRTRLALTEKINVQFVQPGPIYEVDSENRNKYVVDIEDKTYTCPDFEQRRPDGGCKHL